MSVKFRKIARKVIGGPEQGSVKFYAVAKASYYCTFDKLCNLVSTRSKMSASDVKCALDAFIWIMNTELNSGAIIQMGEFGHFRYSLQSEGAETKKELTAHCVKKAKIIFTPGVMLKKSLRDVTFEPEDERIVKEDVECDLPHAI